MGGNQLTTLFNREKELSVHFRKALMGGVDLQRTTFSMGQVRHQWARVRRRRKNIHKRETCLQPVVTFHSNRQPIKLITSSGRWVFKGRSEWSLP